MKILNWAAGISAIIVFVLLISAVSAADSAYALGRKYAWEFFICIGILAIWWFAHKNE